jgi:hypothetical protein
MPNNPNSFWTQDGSNIYNTLAGNVGIGTNAPAVKLDVVGDGKFSNNVIVSGNMGVGTTTPATRLHVIGDGRFSNNVTAGGNIGIGTTAPFYPLHIFNTQGSPLAEFEGQGYNFSIIEIKDLQKIMSLGLNAGTGMLSINDNTPFEIHS